MKFTHSTESVLYLETDEKWSKSSKFSYLYQDKNGEPVPPPSGIRSSVPLGGLGAGTVELRGDGRFMVWNIFNNMPFQTGEKSKPDDEFVRKGVVEEVFSRSRKTQFDGAFLGLRVQGDSGNPIAVPLRTTPIKGYLPVVQQIDYSGAYPVSRLSFTDDRLPLEATLYA